MAISTQSLVFYPLASLNDAIPFGAETGIFEFLWTNTGTLIEANYSLPNPGIYVPAIRNLNGGVATSESFISDVVDVVGSGATVVTKNDPVFGNIKAFDVTAATLSQLNFAFKLVPLPSAAIASILYVGSATFSPNLTAPSGGNLTLGVQLSYDPTKSGAKWVCSFITPNLPVRFRGGTIQAINNTLTDGEELIAIQQPLTDGLFQLSDQDTFELPLTSSAFSDSAGVLVKQPSPIDQITGANTSARSPFEYKIFSYASARLLIDIPNSNPSQFAFYYYLSAQNAIAQLSFANVVVAASTITADVTLSIDPQNDTANDSDQHILTDVANRGTAFTATGVVFSRTN